MKKRLFVAVLMTALLLSVCGNQNVQVEEDTTEIKKQETEDVEPEKFEREFEDSKLEQLGLSLVMENVTPSGATLLFQQADGTPTGMLQFGDDFIIEKQEKGEWKAVSVVVEGNYGFNEIAYSIANGSTTEFKVDWEWLYGKLEPGEYRIGKSVLDFRETGDYDEYMIFGHFILESDSGKDKKSKIVAAIEDKTLSGDIATDDALEKFYSDGIFDYYFSSIKSKYVVVYYSDDTEETVENALNKGAITISDLDRFDIRYYRERKHTP